ncbi:MAG: N-acetyltransferase family protein [Kofleriaceae bacterium]
MITVRAATMADYDAICRLFGEADQLHAELVPGLFRRPDRPSRSRDELARVLASPAAAMLVADDGRELAGVISLVLRDVRERPMFVPETLGVIDALAVAEQHRRRGVGRMLIEGAAAWFRARHTVQVELRVYERNRDAIAFYEQLGFRPLARILTIDV